MSAPSERDREWIAVMRADAKSDRIGLASARYAMIELADAALAGLDERVELRRALAETIEQRDQAERERDDARREHAASLRRLSTFAKLLDQR